MMPRVERTTVEILVLMLAGTVCVSILLTGAALLVIVLWRPEVNVGPVAEWMKGIVTTIVGVLLGLIAGRADTRRERHAGPDAGTDAGTHQQGSTP